MQLQVKWIVRLYRMHQTISRRVIWIFRFEWVEEEVPKNENSAIVFVDVLRISGWFRVGKQQKAIRTFSLLELNKA